MLHRNTRKDEMMSTLSTLNQTAAAPAKAQRTDNDRVLSALLLAAAVAALAVTVDQLIGSWAEDHLLAAWVAMWSVVFAGSLVLAGTARRTAGRLMVRLDAWARKQAQARADARFYAMAQLDSRLAADLQAAKSRQEA